MTGRRLWKVSVTSSPAAGDALAELLQARFGQPAAIYTDLEKARTTVAVYLESKPDWTKARLQSLSQELGRLETGTATAAPRVVLEALRPQDWAEAWKRHFKPLVIGNKLRIRPSWSRSARRGNQVEVVLDPGLSFGTGQHPTTAFCLGELVRACRPGLKQSLLDLGTGSGILALAAAKLGYQPIDALDLDPESIRIAKANERFNQLAGIIRFRCQDLASLPLNSPRRYSVICANLMAELLQAQKSRILAKLQPEGVLVLAGILRSEFAAVQQAYQAEGLRLIKSRSEREWRSGTFRWGEAANKPRVCI